MRITRRTVELLLAMLAGMALAPAFAQETTAPACPPCLPCAVVGPPTPEQTAAVDRALEAIKAAEQPSPGPYGPR